MKAAELRDKTPDQLREELATLKKASFNLRFQAATGCPLIVNTSFNVRGEPIVATPEDAFRCFMGTELDALAIGDCFLDKAAQDPTLKRDYKDSFAPD